MTGANTYATPTGRLAVAAKIGGGSAPGTVFHGRVRTGEIVKVDAPGRDAIVTRILALRGLEANNSQAFSRGIYIHGTPEERNIGRPTSYGCIRMRSQRRDQALRHGASGCDRADHRHDDEQRHRGEHRPARTRARFPAAPDDGHALVGGTVVASTAGATKTIVTSANNTTGATTTTTTTVTPVAKADAPKVTVTTTTKSSSDGSDAKPVAAANGKKEWAGTPTKLLAKQAASEAKTKNSQQRKTAGRRAESVSPLSNNNSNASSALHKFNVRFTVKGRDRPPGSPWLSCQASFQIKHRTARRSVPTFGIRRKAVDRTTGTPQLGGPSRRFLTFPTMANTKSAAKRARQTIKRAARNRSVLSALKTETKRTHSQFAAAGGDKAAAKASYVTAGVGAWTARPSAA